MITPVFDWVIRISTFTSASKKISRRRRLFHRLRYDFILFSLKKKYVLSFYGILLLITNWIIRCWFSVQSRRCFGTERSN